MQFETEDEFGEGDSWKRIKVRIELSFVRLLFIWDFSTSSTTFCQRGMMFRETISRRDSGERERERETREQERELEPLVNRLLLQSRSSSRGGGGAEVGGDVT